MHEHAFNKWHQPTNSAIVGGRSVDLVSSRQPTSITYSTQRTRAAGSVYRRQRAAGVVRMFGRQRLCTRTAIDINVSL